MLHDKLAKLAHEQPELRKLLVPMLRESAEKHKLCFSLSLILSKGKVQGPPKSTTGGKHGVPYLFTVVCPVVVAQENSVVGTYSATVEVYREFLSSGESPLAQAQKWKPQDERWASYYEGYSTMIGAYVRKSTMPEILTGNYSLESMPWNYV
jgi:hypothetical protein